METACIWIAAATSENPSFMMVDELVEDSSNCWIHLSTLWFFSWLYRIKPSVTHEPFHPREPAHKRLVSDFTGSGVASVTPTQLRWKPPPIPEAHTNFIDGLFTVCGAGSPFLRHGYAVHMYVHMIPFPSFCAIWVLLLFRPLEKSLQISYCNHVPQVHGNFFLGQHWLYVNLLSNCRVLYIDWIQVLAVNASVFVKLSGKLHS
jgi:hypothetical protein